MVPPKTAKGMDQRIRQTFSPRVISLTPGDRVFAVDYDQAFFKRNLSAPVLSSGSSLITMQKLLKDIKTKKCMVLLLKRLKKLLIHMVLQTLGVGQKQTMEYKLFHKKCLSTH